MRRRHIHLLFGMVAVTLASLTGWQCMQLQRAERVNQAISRASASDLDSTVPEAMFARARALATSGKYESAVKAYKTLIQGARIDLRHAALYNLGNLHMREALKNGTSGAVQSLPLIELAKQSYRDLLRENPGDWDARYNLERALRLAPEVAEEDSEQNRPAEWQRRVIRALSDFKLELP